MQGSGKVGILEACRHFFRFLDFSVQRRPDTKLRPKKNILYTILSVTSLSVHFSKTHKSRSIYEI